jgi:hypothetical protein
VFPGSPSEPDRLHGLYCVRHKRFVQGTTLFGVGTDHQYDH